MVREYTAGEQFAAWLAEMQASHLEAFQSFVTGVQQDKDAILAGLSLPWSNGPLEGNVNRLKLIRKKHVRSRRTRSAQASSAPSQQKKSGEKKQKARTTGGSDEETDDHEKRPNLSAYHNWDQQGCVRIRLW